MDKDTLVTCISCQTINSSSSNFCMSCGQPLKNIQSISNNNPTQPIINNLDITPNPTRISKSSNKSGFVIGFIIGLIVSSFLGYVLILDPEFQSHNALLISYNKKVTEYDQLYTNYRTLETSYNNKLSDNLQLISENTQLSSEYTQLNSKYLILETDYNQKVYDFNQAYSSWEDLSRDVYSFYQELQSYVSLEDAIPRVINSSELQKIAGTVEEVSEKASYNWDGYWNIHKYVRDEVSYAYDVEIPIISTYSYNGDESQPRITTFQTRTTQNYHQTLEYTVKYKQGDCDDQAMLEYAMIQYYRKYIHGTLYSLYLAHVSFNDGGSHLAVFMPVVDGQICILDPAGKYQTGTWNSIQSKKASTELYNYRDHWKDNGGIKEITLWRIDIDTGEYTEVFKGSLTETISFF